MILLLNLWNVQHSATYSGREEIYVYKLVQNN
jgi:hypothetical protein